MRKWRLLEAGRSITYSPIGLRLRDDFTDAEPIGRVTAHLDILEGGTWRPTEIRAVWSGPLLSYPGLGRQRDVVGQPSRRCRVRIESEHYIPLYRATVDGIEFDVHPHNDTNPPAALTTAAFDLALGPAASYPYPGHVPVVRGVVVDSASGEPMADAEVTEGARERVVTDKRGSFALPMRWVAPGVPTPIDAVHHRSTPNLTGSLVVTLPAALAASQTVPIS